LRVGKAGDDELLAVLALELEPVTAAAGLMRRVGPLGDHALPVVAARVRPVGLAVGVAVRGVPQRPAERQQPPQEPLALPQRQAPDIGAVRAQDVEQVEVDRHSPAQVRSRIAHPEPPLQPGEAGRLSGESDHLTVHQEVARVLGAIASASSG
jgi:hypothetical protein